MFQSEYATLCKLMRTPPCKLFPFELDKDDESSDTNTQENRLEEKGGMNESENDSSDDDDYYDAITFDDLFIEHSLWLKRFRMLKPSYKQCVEWTREAKTTNETLQKHVASQPKHRASKGWSMFDELSHGNNIDIFEKKQKQYEDLINEREESIGRFQSDLLPRREALQKWESQVEERWSRIASLFRLYNVPVSKHSMRTMDWLYKKKIVPSSYLSNIDMGHYLCSALLPSRYTILFLSVVTQLGSSGGVDWRFSSRAWGSLELLNMVYPRLRDWRTSQLVVRTDMILIALAMWTFDMDVWTTIGVTSMMQLWMFLCANDMAIHYPFGEEESGNDSNANEGVDVDEHVVNDEYHEDTHESNSDGVVSESELLTTETQTEESTNKQKAD